MKIKKISYVCASMILASLSVNSAEVTGDNPDAQSNLMSVSLYVNLGDAFLGRYNEINEQFKAQEAKPFISFIHGTKDKHFFGPAIKRGFIELTAKDLLWIVENTSGDERKALLDSFFEEGKSEERNSHARTILGFQKLSVTSKWFWTKDYNFITYCIDYGYNDIFKGIVDFAPNILVSPNQVKNHPEGELGLIAWLSAGVTNNNKSLIEASKILVEKAVEDKFNAAHIAGDFFSLAEQLLKLKKITQEQLDALGLRTAKESADNV